MPDTLTQPLNIRGKARKRDDSDLLLLALLLLVDVTDALAWWEQIAPPAYRTMLSGPGWTYNPVLLQWTRGTRPLPSATVKQAVILAVADAESVVRQATAQMVTGATPLPVWQDQMLATVKQTQIAVATVARGGVANMPADELARTKDVIPDSPADVKSTGDMVAFQTKRLQKFAEDIEAEDPKVDTLGKIESRAVLYVRQAISTYEEARRRSGAAIGVTEAINVLDRDADHCFSRKGDPIPDCPSITAAGWMALESMPPIGLRKCLVNCRCSLRFRLKDGTELP